MKQSKYIQKKWIVLLEDDEESEIAKWSLWDSPNKRWERYCKHQCINMVEITANMERDKKYIEWVYYKLILADSFSHLHAFL